MDDFYTINLQDSFHINTSYSALFYAVYLFLE